MSQLRHDAGVLVRFWSLDHHRAEPVLWPVSPWPKLVYSMEGALQVESRSRLYVLPPNRAIWIEAGESHPAETLGRARVRTLYFSPVMEFQRPTGLVEVRPLLRELIAESCLSGPLFANDPRSEAMATLLRFEVEQASSIPAGIAIPQSYWLREWTSQFLKYPLELPSSAWSRRTLERHMLKETGLTLGQWCQQARALIALRALSTGSTVLEAGIEAGFATPSGFIQSFKRQFGTTPGRFGGP
ncbi:MAG: helix-turn-helix domain-containing protein [Chlorobia bacterium]|nr:helix-turn-helix domain-containing protein [Fimbriimonadaceae bacterium]